MQTIKNILAQILYYSGLTKLLSSVSRQRFIILMYHHIGKDNGVSKEDFEKQLNFLRKNFEIVSLEDLVADLDNGKNINRNKVALAFDDGYKDFLTQAYPVLKRYNVGATIFLATDFIDGKDIPWTEKLRIGIKNSKQKQILLKFNSITGSFDLVKERHRTLERIKNFLKGLPDTEKEAILGKLLKDLDFDASKIKVNEYMLDWDDVRFLSRNGISFGAHTLSHPILTKVSLDEARRQIQESKKIIEGKLCKPVNLFCYPNGKNGDFNDEIVKIVKESGFIGACTAIEGPNDKQTNVYKLSRIPAYEKNIAGFALKLVGLFHWNIKNQLINFKDRVFEAIKDRFQLRRLIFFEKFMPFDSNEIPQISVQIPITVRQITSSDFSKLYSLRPYLTKENIVSRLKNKDKCFVAEYRGEIINFIWIAYKDKLEAYINDQIDLKEKEAYIYNGFTSPKFRRKGILQYVLKNIIEYLSDEGIKRIVAACIPNVTASVRSLKKLKFSAYEQRIHLRLPFFEKKIITKVDKRGKADLGNFIRDIFHFRRVVMLQRYLPFDSEEIANKMSGEEKISNINVREITEFDIPRLNKIRPYLTESLIRHRLLKKDKGFIAEYKGEIIAFSWISYTDNYDYYLRQDIEVKDDEALSFNSFAIRDRRGMGALYWILKRKLEVTTGEGIKRVIAACVIDNIAPIKGLRRFGFLPYEIRTYIRFFGFEKRFKKRIDNPNTANLGKASRFLRLPPVLVLGMTYTGLGIIRSLSKRKIDISGVDSIRNEKTFSSRFGKKFVCPDPDDNPRELVDFLINLSRKSKYDKVILIPAKDVFVEFISDHREKLSRYFKFILPQKHIIDSLIDKGKFSLLCEKFGLAHPKTYFLDEENGIEEIAELARFPVLIKPACSYRFQRQLNEKGYKAVSKEELIKLYNSYIKDTYKDKIMVQEFVDGDDSQNYSCAVYFDKASNPVASFIARKLRQCPIDMGVGSLVESVELPEIREKAISFLSQIRYKGIAEVEFKRDQITGEFKIIEVNPRSWIQNNLAAACGIDFSCLLYSDLAGMKRPKINEQKQGIKWLGFEWDLKSLLMYKRQGRIKFSGWFNSLRGRKVYALFTWRDPMPFVISLFSFIKDLSEFLRKKIFPAQMPKSYILTTYPIPQSKHWREHTELLEAQVSNFNLFKAFAIRDITLPFKLLCLRKNYKVIITGSEREDMLFALLQTILAFGKRPHIMMCCLWKKEQNLFMRILKRLLFKLVSVSVTYFEVWSKEEIGNYSQEFGIPKNKLIFLPHHCSLDGYDFKPRNGDYIFAGGNSSRDYRTLIEAVRPLKVKTIIALTDYRLIKGVDVPGNVKIISPGPGDFRRIMAQARMVVIPLKKDLLQSAGQQTYLNAMAMKKPVIVSGVAGAKDYIENDSTGIIVPPDDVGALRNAINNVLLDGAYIKEIVENAYIKASTEFTLEKFVERNLVLAEKLIGSKG